MKTSVLYLPDVGTAAEREQGMAGMRADLYQRMLSDLSDQAKLADDLGYSDLACYGGETETPQLDALAAINQRQHDRFADPEVLARIRQYEMAYRMQASVPDLTDLSKEPKNLSRSS